MLQLSHAKELLVSHDICGYLIKANPIKMYQLISLFIHYA